MPSENQAIKQTQDTLFTELFNQAENFVELYKVFTGEQLNPDELRPYRLETNLITRPLYNDVSFLTKDNKFLILTEHQSTPNKNMGARFIMYCSELWRVYLTEQNKKLSDATKIELPDVECYVAYTGKQKYSEEDLVYDGKFLKLSPRLVNIRFEKLAMKDKGSKLAGYSYFQHKREEAREMKMSPSEVFDYAVSECRKNGYLGEMIERTDFVVKYKDVVDREEELMLACREEGLQAGMQKVFCAVIQSGMSTESFVEMAKGLGINEQQAHAFYNQVKSQPQQIKPFEGR